MLTGARTIVVLGGYARRRWLQDYKRAFTGGVWHASISEHGELQLTWRRTGRQDVRVLFGPHPSSWREFSRLIGVLGEAHGLDTSKIVANLQATKGPISYAIESLNECEGGDFTAISIKSKNRRFVLSDGAVTHNCDRITLYMVDEDAAELVCEVGKDGAKGSRIPLGHGVAGHTALTGRSLNITDAQTDWSASTIAHHEIVGGVGGGWGWHSASSLPPPSSEGSATAHAGGQQHTSTHARVALQHLRRHPTRRRSSSRSRSRSRRPPPAARRPTAVQSFRSPLPRRISSHV